MEFQLDVNLVDVKRTSASALHVLGQAWHRFFRHVLFGCGLQGASQCDRPHVWLTDLLWSRVGCVYYFLPKLSEAYWSHWIVKLYVRVESQLLVVEARWFDHVEAF